MNTNHTTSNTNNQNNQGEKSMFKEAKLRLKSILPYALLMFSIICLLTFLPKAFGAVAMDLLCALGAARIIVYLGETKRNKVKRNYEGWGRSIYTQEDFEKFRETLTEELYKEMKNNAYVEISTEKEELEKERRKMKTFLRKHNTGGVVFEKFEEDILIDVGLYLGECFSDDLYEHNTLKDFVKFFDGNREDFIMSIQDVAVNLCILDKLLEGLAYYCLDKKDLRELRKKLHKAYCSKEIGETGIYEYREEKEHDFSEENEATFRC